MKRIEFLKLATLSGLTLLAVPSCSDLELDKTENQLTDPSSGMSDAGSTVLGNPFHANVGKNVPLPDAKNWTKQFNDTNSYENYFQINKEDVQQILESNDCEGVIFQFACDDNDRLELILTSMSSAGQLAEGDQFAIPGSRNTTLMNG